MCLCKVVSRQAMNTAQCPICGVFRSEHTTTLCSPCCLSYDRYSFKDGSVYAALIWAATRARRFERARAKKIDIPVDDSH